MLKAESLFLLKNACTVLDAPPSPSYEQGCADERGLEVASRPPLFSKLQEKWSKVGQAAKRVSHSIFCDFF